MPHTLSTPPHDLDAERATLGSLLIDPDAVLSIAGLLTPDDFYDPVLGAIYGAMVNLFDSRTSIDLLTVSRALETNEQVQAAGGPALVAEIGSDLPTSANVSAYATIVREHSVKRRAAAMARAVERCALDPNESVDAVIDRAEREVLQLSRQTASNHSCDLAVLRDERFAHYAEVYEAEDKAAYYGLTTGFPDVDRLITGLPPGDVIVVAARPSMGKTAFALDVAQHVVNKLDKTVLFLSLEMSKEQVADRIFAGALQVSTHDLKKGIIDESHFQQMGDVFDGIPSERLYIDDDCDSTLGHLRSKARRHQMEHGLDLLIVDYLQLIDVGTKNAPENRVQEVSKISRDLKRLARELKVPVIAVSQLSRNVENRTDKRPQLSDLRESGSIEQDADTVLMLYRDDYYNEDSGNPGVTDVFVRKQRQGPTGRVELHFDAKSMRYQSLARPDGPVPPTV